MIRSDARGLNPAWAADETAFAPSSIRFAARTGNTSATTASATQTTTTISRRKVSE